MLSLATAFPWLSFAALYAAAGKVEITPDLKGHRVYLAGFGVRGRRTEGVRDPLYARALAVSDGKKTVVFVGLDLIGLYRADVLDLRRATGFQGRDKLLFITCTHDHSGPDTLGLWGPFPGISGVDIRYQKELKRRVARLVLFLGSHLKPAEMRVAQRRLDPRGLAKDIRDPVVMDPQILAVRVSALSGEPIATLVRWSCHPETLKSGNRKITADFPGFLCAKMENDWGGTCVFLQGLIGGLLTPDTPPGLSVEQYYGEARRIGILVENRAAQMLKKAGVYFKDCAVDWRIRTVRLPVQNPLYLTLLPHLAFGHPLLDSSGGLLPYWERYWIPLEEWMRFPLPEGRLPWIETEISWVRVGPLEILGVPGEMFPELFWGGYRGEERFGNPLISKTNKNPPDLSRAPPGPYIKDWMHGRYNTAVGLADDEIGYIVPEYDFKITPNRLMFPQPQGNHYEETNSLGNGTASALVRASEDLLKEVRHR